MSEKGLTIILNIIGEMIGLVLGAFIAKTVEYFGGPDYASAAALIICIVVATTVTQLVVNK